MKIKRIAGSILVCISILPGANAQVITVENGFAVSRVKNSFDDKNIFPYQMSAGVEYWDHGRYSLSTNLGFLKKGGKATVYNLDETPGGWGQFASLRLHARYITLNTMWNIKTKPQRGFYWVFGLGPRVDMKINHSLYWDDFSPLASVEPLPGLRSVLWGLIGRVGVCKEIGKLQIGLHAAYLPTFNQLSKTCEGLGGGRDRTFTLGLSFGYIVNKDKGRRYSVRRPTGKTEAD